MNKEEEDYRKSISLIDECVEEIAQRNLSPYSVIFSLIQKAVSIAIFAYKPEKANEVILNTSVSILQHLIEKDNND